MALDDVRLGARLTMSMIHKDEIARHPSWASLVHVLALALRLVSIPIAAMMIRRYH